MANSHSPGEMSSPALWWCFIISGFTKGDGDSQELRLAAPCLGLMGRWLGHGGGSQLEAATGFSLPPSARGERASPCLCAHSGRPRWCHPSCLCWQRWEPGRPQSFGSCSTSFMTSLSFLLFFSSRPLSGASISFPPAVSSSASPFPSPPSRTMHLLASLLPSHEATPSPSGDQVPVWWQGTGHVSVPWQSAAGRARGG